MDGKGVKELWKGPADKQPKQPPAPSQSQNEEFPTAGCLRLGFAFLLSLSLFFLRAMKDDVPRRSKARNGREYELRSCPGASPRARALGSPVPEAGSPVASPLCLHIETINLGPTESCRVHFV